MELIFGKRQIDDFGVCWVIKLVLEVSIFVISKIQTSRTNFVTQHTPKLHCFLLFVNVIGITATPFVSTSTITSTQKENSGMKLVTILY